jgi:glycosyltransferase involved in cell wall biosynthesis
VKLALNGLFLGGHDGTGRYTRELLRAAARLDDGPRRWQVVGLSTARGSSGSPIDPLPRRADCEWLDPPSFAQRENAAKLWFEQRGFPAAAARGGADLMHYPYFAAPLRAGTPFVVTVHDLIPLLLPEYRGSRLVRAYMSLQSVTVRRAQVILADSNASRHDVVRLLNVPRQRVRVVHLGVDPEFRPVPSAEVRAKYGLPERYVLYNGGLDARKNVERLILAYARARASHGVTEPLAITGDYRRRGGLYRPLPPLVAQLGLQEHVRFVGFAHGDLVALLSGCALFVFPSRYEGFGLPPLEAMACGAVVASSTGGSLAEIVGDAAITFTPDDEAGMAEAIARGLHDEPLRERLRALGRARAAEFTWEKTARATLEAYRDACA